MTFWRYRLPSLAVENTNTLCKAGLILPVFFFKNFLCWFEVFLCETLSTIGILCWFRKRQFLLILPETECSSFGSAISPQKRQCLVFPSLGNRSGWLKQQVALIVFWRKSQPSFYNQSYTSVTGNRESSVGIGKWIWRNCNGIGKRKVAVYFKWSLACIF